MPKTKKLLVSNPDTKKLGFVGREFFSFTFETLMKLTFHENVKM